ncbi:hypothetical protein [Acinetobacter stercoris]|uniref:Uncharacterized protein n=1 Tax=Acinetobacter stercoris TaxID=2126983 RepID=A0A2U3MY04_9GAMM|nr:hypothetical protein [Acinetobacter stercoris]SPL70316.1 hypothetical protein KPC_1494 [Acinetobacter stercoris]
MKHLTKKILITSFLAVSISSTFAEEREIRYIASAKKASVKYRVYICEYKIIYDNYEKQKAFGDDDLANEKLDFIYKKSIDSVFQREDHPINEPVQNLNIKVNFDLKMNNEADNIRINPSTGSESLDKSIKDAFKNSKFFTHKMFWWGPIKFSEEITLEKMGKCRVREIR